VSATHTQYRIKGNPRPVVGPGGGKELTMRYLINDECGGMYQTDTLTVNEFAAFNDSIIAIIDMDTKTEYAGGDEWSDLAIWGA